MPLKLKLAVGERIAINGALIQVDQGTGLTFLGRATILREAHMLEPEQGDTPAKLAYLALQDLALTAQPTDEDLAAAADGIAALRQAYARLDGADEIMSSVATNAAVGSYHQALRQLRSLIAIEASALGRPAPDWSGPSQADRWARVGWEVRSRYQPA